MDPGEHKDRPYGSQSVGANPVFALPYFALLESYKEARPIPRA
jgi:hypothetical protein